MASISDAKGSAGMLRAKIKDLGDETKQFRDNTLSAALAAHDNSVQGDSTIDKGEALANATLAYRHLEDARMRLGKVIQALDGGVSIFDKPAANAS